MGKVIEFDELCQACQGTGIYVGMAERDGSGIVCYKCSGTGRYHFKREYREFRSRVQRNDVLRVYECNPGITIGSNEKLSLSDFGGMPYDDWKTGNPFPEYSENRRFTCPAWWYQTADFKKKPDWDWCAGACTFSECKRFATKDKCWERFDNQRRSQ